VQEGKKKGNTQWFRDLPPVEGNEATREVSVIFMTALTDVENKVIGFEAGAVDYITKPVEYQEVVARLTTHLTLRKLQKSLSQKNAELQAKNKQLQQALDQVKRLNGLLPICANCKQIRDDMRYWHDVAGYIQDHSEAEFTHGICPDCMKKLYPEFFGGNKKGARPLATCSLYRLGKLTLKYPQQNQDQDDDHQKSETPTWAIPPTSAVRPSRESTQKQ
jgi:CheY-like chemotaxis protein